MWDLTGRGTISCLLLNAPHVVLHEDEGRRKISRRQSRRGRGFRGAPPRLGYRSSFLAQGGARIRAIRAMVETQVPWRRLKRTV